LAAGPTSRACRSAFQGVNDLFGSSDLAEVGKDLGEGVRLGRSIDIGDSIFGGSSSGQNAA
jgi:hypothetical protein